MLEAWPLEVLLLGRWLLDMSSEGGVAVWGVAPAVKVALR